MRKCWRCGAIQQEEDPGPVMTVQELEAWLKANGFPIWAGLRTSPAGTAKVLNVTVSTLANRRSKGGGLPYVRSGQHGGVSYRLQDIVNYLKMNSR